MGKQPAQISADLNRVFDLLVGSPAGVTIDDIAEHLSVSYNTANRYISRLREVFADGKETVVCDPQGVKERWLYRIVSEYEDTRFWCVNRTGDMESRLHTMISVASSVAKMTDGRSIEGKKARKIQRTLEYLEQELAEIAA